MNKPKSNGTIIKADDGRVNEDLKRYMAEMKADPAKLREVVQAPDTFEASIPVYTYDGGNIIEEKCEKPGWPNVTHAGHMMYENTYSTDKRKVVKWAKENATLGIKWQSERVEEIKRDLAKMEALVKESEANLAKLEADYPKNKSNGQAHRSAATTERTNSNVGSKEFVSRLVDRFLQWPLPESVCADLCATKQQAGRIGTNLLTATEAKEMIEYLLGPALSKDATTEEEGESYTQGFFDGVDHAKSANVELRHSAGSVASKTQKPNNEH
ncbi:MAG: hypothetical protein KGL39_43775 [Patescibacteria group bacterium]|nr:hypothetical protein [Patescibacteria group bacterium]